MSRTKRWLAGVSLVVYLLATTAVHFLHDHSAAEHCGHAYESHVAHDEAATIRARDACLSRPSLRRHVLRLPVPGC